MDSAYQTVIEALMAKGIRAEFHRSDQLVLTDRGGTTSVWISLHNGQWFISTWTPACYPIPNDVNVVEVCEMFLQAKDRGFYVIPTEICDRFGLVRMTNEQFEQLSPADCLDEL